MFSAHSCTSGALRQRFRRVKRSQGGRASNKPARLSHVRCVRSIRVAFSATEFWLNEKTGPLVRFTVKRDDAEPDAEEFWLNEIQAVLVTAATVTAAKVCRRPNACRAQSCQAATSVDGERKKGRGGPWVGALSGDPAR